MEYSRGKVNALEVRGELVGTSIEVRGLLSSQGDESSGNKRNGGKGEERGGVRLLERSFLAWRYSWKVTREPLSVMLHFFFVKTRTI